jgi:hypothetical protein
MSRTAGRFKLPQPLDLKDETEWVVIPRIARTIPFGYKIEEDDPDVLVPIPDELDLLEKAKNYLKQYSYREVANWLSKNSGRYISHVGLRKRVGVEQQRQNKAKSLRIWAEYAQKAISKAQALEEKRTGAKQDRESVSD